MSKTTPATVSNLARAADDKNWQRLKYLLETRDRLAAAAAVFEAHRLPDAQEIRRVQYATEYVIGTEFDPAVHGRLRPVWDARDAELMHDGAIQRNAECPICNGEAIPDLRRILAPRAA
jgi:hypothetical protein